MNMAQITSDVTQFLHNGIYYQILTSVDELRLLVDGKVVVSTINMGSMIGLAEKDARIAELESAITGLLERSPCVDYMVKEYRTDICAYCDDGHFVYPKPLVHLPDCKYVTARKSVGADCE